MHRNRRDGLGGQEPTPEGELSVVRFELKNSRIGTASVERWIEWGWINPDALEEVKVMLLKAKLKE